MTPASTDRLLELAALWGPALVILAGLYALARRPPSIVQDLVKAQQAQAEAMGKLANGVMHLPQRGDLKFDELLIGQQMILTQLDKIDSQCRQRALLCSTIQTVSEGRFKGPGLEEPRDPR